MADETPPPSMPSSEGPRAEPGAIVPGAPPLAPPSAIKVEPPTMPPIALDPSQVQKSPHPASKGTPKDVEVKDTFRELMETVVFVVVLVLMLKTFLAEAFVIPTGSMADTLLGYHYKVTCTECGYRNLVNASSEAEPPRGDSPLWIVSCQCQNCGATNIIRNIPQLQRGGQP